LHVFEALLFFLFFLLFNIVILFFTLATLKYFFK
jgi:hypothetical protein